MRSLRFDELLLMSQVERAARRVPLHPETTIVRGANDTGKSAILKSLYATLGADPPNIHPRWQNAGAISSLRFRVDEQRFRAIRHGSRFSFFDENDQLIDSYTSVTKELGPAIAQLFDFRLLLTSNRGGDETQATPAFLFLPFYIDQDAGWTDKLCSFSRLKQFKSPIRDVLFFHFGIRPSEYYAAKAKMSAAEAEAQPLRQEREMLDSVLQRVEAELEMADFSLNLDAFRDEVELLLDRCNSLQEEETIQRSRMAAAYGSLKATIQQHEITRRALDELRADREFAASIAGDHIQCPVCHAEYENGFAERFAIAVDEDSCMALLAQLDEDRRRAESDYEEAKNSSERAKSLVIGVKSLLEVKREQLVLQDILRSEGRREMRRVVRRQIAELDEKIGAAEAAKIAAKKAMKQFEDKTRSKEIQDFYRGEVTRLLQRLEVRNLPPESYKRIDARVKETGSDQPRAILAFFLAQIHTIDRYSSCAMCPLVIDSPQQQDQDSESYQKILDAIRDERPTGVQLILALADDRETDFGGGVIELTRKHHVLRQEDYNDARSELVPLLDASVRHSTD